MARREFTQTCVKALGDHSVLKAKCKVVIDTLARINRVAVVAQSFVAPFTFNPLTKTQWPDVLNEQTPAQRRDNVRILCNVVTGSQINREVPICDSANKRCSTRDARRVKKDTNGNVVWV